MPSGRWLSKSDQRDLSLAVLVGVLAFAYRFLSHSGFVNDQFVHLARAQAMLLGDLPIRDYTEEGIPLTVLLAAALQRVLGPSPFAELVFAVTSLALAAAVTYWLTARLTGARVLAVTAAVLQILAAPRLYSHPKILIYPVFMLMAIWYIQRPGIRRLSVLAAWTAVAFLLRHDHGVYVGLGAAATVLFAHWRQGNRVVIRRALQYAAVLVLCVSPYLAYVQWQLGVVEYLRLGLVISQNESNDVLAWPTFERWTSGPVLIHPPDDLSYLPLIHVRWRPGVTDEMRTQYERELGLLVAQPDAVRTWKYRVDPGEVTKLAQLAALSDAEDFQGFDRTTLRLTDIPGFFERVIRRYRPGEIRLGPAVTSVVTETNAVAVLFYLLRLLPIAAFLVWWLRGNQLRQVEHGPAVAVLCVLSWVCGFGLGRETLGHRVADTFGTLPILAMWMVAAAVEQRPAHGIARAIASATIGVSIVALVSAVWLLGGASEMIRRTGVYEGVHGLVTRGHTVFAQTTRWPWAQEWPGANDWPVLEYVRDCSRPMDRLLVTWHAPQFHFFSGRAFAGGETALMPVRRPTATFEAQVIDRLKKQSVPIVLSEASLYPGFAASYPGIATYLETRYDRAGEANYGPGDHILVYVDKLRQPTRHDPTFGFPCFG